MAVMFGDAAFYSGQIWSPKVRVVAYWLGSNRSNFLTSFWFTASILS